MTKERRDELIKIHLAKIEKMWKAEPYLEASDLAFLELIYNSACKQYAHVIERILSMDVKQNKRRA